MSHDRVVALDFNNILRGNDVIHNNIPVFLSSSRKITNKTSNLFLLKVLLHDIRALEPIERDTVKSRIHCPRRIISYRDMKIRNM